MKKEADHQECEHFVTPEGVSSLVKHYFKGAQPQFGKHVSSLDLREDRSAWTVRTQTGESEDFGAVVLTMPVPQILGLSGSISGMIRDRPEIKNALESVKYSSRYALGLFWDEPAVDLGLGPKVAEYIIDDPVYR